MDGKNVKKYEENGQFSCGIYRSPAATPLSLQRLGGRSLDIYNMYVCIHYIYSDD